MCIIINLKAGNETPKIWLSDFLYHIYIDPLNNLDYQVCD